MGGRLMENINAILELLKSDNIEDVRLANSIMEALGKKFTIKQIDALDKEMHGKYAYDIVGKGIMRHKFTGKIIEVNKHGIWYEVMSEETGLTYYHHKTT